MICGRFIKIGIFLILGLQIISCKEIYKPPSILKNPGFLVVDGFLNAGSDSTIIRLSRTRNLDSIVPIPETNAQVIVMGALGETFLMPEKGSGRYIIDHLPLNTGEIYQLKIITNDNRIYQSDTFPSMRTPPVDRLSWKQDVNGVTIKANAHDPQNKTRNYRWEYVETWEYHTGKLTVVDYDGSKVVFRSNDNLIYYCWMTLPSTNIIVGSTSKLSEDVVSGQVICEVPAASEKMSYTYSILVSQYGITTDAYNYWQDLRKNNDLTGSIFDAQPSQLTGNIHCLSNPEEMVLGFMGASTVEKKRIFINKEELTDWGYLPYYIECSTSLSAYKQVDINDPRRQEILFDYLLKPNYSFTLLDSGVSGYLLVQNFCADCREHGGINKKPSFWT